MGFWRYPTGCRSPDLRENSASRSAQSIPMEALTFFGALAEAFRANIHSHHWRLGFASIDGLGLCGSVP